MNRNNVKPPLWKRIKAGASWIIGFVAIIWAVELLNMAMGHSLNTWGIRPRELSGLPGILFSPFLHGSLNHVLLNTVAILILGTMVAVRGVKPLLEATIFIILLGGAGVWIFGRSATQHVGASGLVFGYFGYLLSRGWYGRDFISIILAVLALVLYGGMLWGIVPFSEHISWEGHLFGLIAGVLVGAIHSRKRSG